MSSTSEAQAAPFARAVVSAMRRLYPEALADKSFDNTGLLLEAPFDPKRRPNNSVLLTVDLTRAVADEAIERQDCAIVAYHPIIFRGLKSLTLGDTQQQSLLRLALAGISVYSPHTAVDAAPGGLSDWLADIVTGSAPKVPGVGPSLSRSSSAGYQSADEEQRPELPPRMYLQRQYSRPKYPRTHSYAPDQPEGSSKGDAAKQTASTGSAHTRTVIQPSPDPPESFEGAGIGRLVQFEETHSLPQLIDRIARGMGSPAGFPVAVPQGKSVESIKIRSVAVCAGSGGGVFRDIDADLLFTGELSHHEALAATERGACVITLFHSNTERGFLRAVMQPRLEAALNEEWKKMRNESSSSELKDAYEDDSVEVECSSRDRDPYGVVMLQNSRVPGVVLGTGEVKVQDGQ